MSTAIGYTRVSTTEQANSGLGLDAQVASIEATASRLGLRLREIHTDAGVSGGLAMEARPALVQAVDSLKRGDTLLVAKRDRLGRDVLNVALISRLVERKGARIVSAAGEGSDDDGPTSVLMRQIIDAFAQYERAIIGARTRAALQAKRARGERAGTIPFGWQLGEGTVLVPNGAEQHVLDVLRQLRRSGATLRATAFRLNDLGHRTRRGGLWRYQYVARHDAPEGRRRRQ